MQVWMISQQIKNTGEHVGHMGLVFKTEHAANLYVAKRGDVEYMNHLVSCVHVLTTDEVKEMVDLNSDDWDYIDDDRFA